MLPHKSYSLMVLFIFFLTSSSLIYFTYYLLCCVGEGRKFNSIDFSILTFLIFNLYWINIGLFCRGFVFDVGWMFNTLKIVFLCTFFCNLPICVSIKILCFDGWNVTHITRNMEIKMMSLR